MANFILPLLSLGMGGIGEIGNLTTGKKQAQAEAALQSSQANELNWMQNYQQYLQNLSPGQIDTMLQQLTQPLTQQQINAASGPVLAQLGLTGMAGSPGTTAEELGQAYAPMISSNQNLAAQLLGMKLSAPLAPGQSILQTSENLPSYFPQPTNPAGWFQLAAQTWPKSGTDPGTPQYQYPGYPSFPTLPGQTPPPLPPQGTSPNSAQNFAPTTNSFTGLPFNNAGGLNFTG
jgi:hypothetical protein